MAFGITGFGARQVYPSPQIFQALSLGGAPPVPPNPPYGNPNENLVPVARTGNPAFPANLTLVAHSTYQALLQVQNQVQLVQKNPQLASSTKGSAAATLTAAATPSSTSNQTLLTQARPQVPATANSTASVEAPNPAVSGQVQGPSSNGIPARIDLPLGQIAFQVLEVPSSVTSGVDALNQTIASLQPALKAAQQPAANPNAANANANGNANGTAASGPANGATAPGNPASGAPGGTPPATQPTTPAPAAPGLVGKIVQTVQNLAVAAVYSSPVFSFSA
jgi:hypothetical protein